MKEQTFVVWIEGTDMYMIAYNLQDPPASLFGNGTVGTTKPR